MPDIRPFAPADFDAVVARWHETNVVSYRYVRVHQEHTLEDARAFFRDHVVPSCEVWVAAGSTTLMGVLALEGCWIRHLAVFPEFQRHGVGTTLLQKARESAGDELRLFTFQRNVAARAFYERHGFVAVAFGVSPAPESEPDIEYRWNA